MNIMKLLEYMQEIVETGSKLPLSRKVSINKKEMTDVINQIMDELPDEFKKAQKLINDREKIISDALKEADAIRERNLKNIREEVEKHDITKEAEEKAQSIIISAKKEAEDIKLASIEYAYKLLTKLDEQIEIRKNETVNRIKKDMEQFDMDIENDFKSIRDIITENIDELKNVK
ncbi:ATPase [Clostridium neuense]|uniref:ATPase n=1 Tax=Clostridium neuense TaxID=1728934 RepID=A0ABW8TBI9_9CLOT